jgi:hypothetical protein
MSLADFYNKVNTSGAQLYSLAQGRIVREGGAHKDMMEKREADKSTQEIAHMRLHKENISGKIQELKKDIYDAKRAGYTPSLVAEKEKMLHKLQNDHLHLQGEILGAQGRTNMASNIRFHNPHYF